MAGRPGQQTFGWARYLSGPSHIAVGLGAGSLAQRGAKRTARIGQLNRGRCFAVGSCEALYRRAEVFDKAHRLVDKYQERAERIADDVSPDSLRRLLYYLVDTVLERPTQAHVAIVQPTLPS